MKINLIMLHVTYFRNEWDYCSVTTKTPAGHTRRILSYDEMLKMLKRIMSNPSANYAVRRAGDTTLITADLMNIKV